MPQRAASASTSALCLCALEAGSSHLEQGLACHDAADHLNLPGRLFLALADGAGSALHAGRGSSLAVAAALEAARGAWPSDMTTARDQDWQAALVDVLRAARAALEDRVERTEAETETDGAVGEPLALRDLATTFLFAAIDHQRVGIVHVGDGWGVIEEADGRFSVLSPPDRSEYFNETVFLTGDRFEEDARVTIRKLDGAGSVVLMSDGLEMVLIDLARGEPHQPAFTGLLTFARDSRTSVEERISRLSRFLRSDRVCKKTDDDKSLLMAVLDSQDEETSGYEPTSR